MVRYVTFTLASVAAVHVFLRNVPAKYSSSGEEHPVISMLVTVEAEGVCHATWEILLKKSGVIVLFLDLEQISLQDYHVFAQFLTSNISQFHLFTTLLLQMLVLF